MALQAQVSLNYIVEIRKTYPADAIIKIDNIYLIKIHKISVYANQNLKDMIKYHLQNNNQTELYDIYNNLVILY